mmetsp:Transcript_5657/g.17254  ORF Transcript_5657/g.17254 Transcript_5657/m.17254 type:complete len:404 (+) Transcript_5657:791-2002(+)
MHRLPFRASTSVAALALRRPASVRHRLHALGAHRLAVGAATAAPTRGRREAVCEVFVPKLHHLSVLQPVVIAAVAGAVVDHFWEVGGAARATAIAAALRGCTKPRLRCAAQRCIWAGPPAGAAAGGQLLDDGACGGGVRHVEAVDALHLHRHVCCRLRRRCSLQRVVGPSARPLPTTGCWAAAARALWHCARMHRRRRRLDLIHQPTNAARVAAARHPIVDLVVVVVIAAGVAAAAAAPGAAAATVILQLLCLKLVLAILALVSAQRVLCSRGAAGGSHRQVERRDGAADARHAQRRRLHGAGAAEALVEAGLAAAAERQVEARARRLLAQPLQRLVQRGHAHRAGATPRNAARSLVHALFEPRRGWAGGGLDWRHRRPAGRQLHRLHPAAASVAAATVAAER